MGALPCGHPAGQLVITRLGAECATCALRHMNPADFAEAGAALNAVHAQARSLITLALHDERGQMVAAVPDDPVARLVLVLVLADIAADMHQTIAEQHGLTPDEALALWQQVSVHLAADGPYPEQDAR